jgi:hypothetical protein
VKRRDHELWLDEVGKDRLLAGVFELRNVLHDDLHNGREKREETS